MTHRRVNLNQIVYRSFICAKSNDFRSSHIKDSHDEQSRARLSVRLGGEVGIDVGAGPSVICFRSISDAVERLQG